MAKLVFLVHACGYYASNAGFIDMTIVFPLKSLPIGCAVFLRMSRARWY
jgi:hypothetical protein